MKKFNVNNPNGMFANVDPEKIEKLIAGIENGEASEGDETEEKSYKTIATTAIVTVISYMLGMADDKLEAFYGGFNGDILKQLRDNKEATIIRYLCRLRTALMQNFLNTDNEMRNNLKNIDRLDWFNINEIKQLQKWNVDVVRVNIRADAYSELFNDLIAKHIAGCKNLFPDWLNYEFIRELFVVPKYTKKNVLKEEYDKYQGNRLLYPFQMYMHWNPKECGNLLNSDGKFLKVLYEQHGQEFNDKTKYRDAVEETKRSIYDFIDNCCRVEIVVDCENSDVFKLYSVLKNLDNEEVSKIEKIVLYDDYHTSVGWDYLANLISIPVEHIEVDRVTDRKSLVDLRMTAGICQAFYRDQISSFILCSSDSDFWGVISALPDADFLVLFEDSKCGKDIKDALTLRSIYHCSMDNFYSGNAGELKKIVLRKALENEAEDIVGKDAYEIARRVHEENHIEATDAEIQQFYDKYVKNVRLKINQDGVFVVDIPG